MLSDIRYALRQLIRTPAFSCAAIFALALGIGANVAIFSTVNAVLLNSLPFRSLKQPERLVSLYTTNPVFLQFMAGRMGVDDNDLLAWKEQAHSFTAIEGYKDAALNLTAASSSNHREPEQVDAVLATPGFCRCSEFRRVWAVGLNRMRAMPMQLSSATIYGAAAFPPISTFSARAFAPPMRRIKLSVFWLPALSYRRKDWAWTKARRKSGFPFFCTLSRGNILVLP